MGNEFEPETKQYQESDNVIRFKESNVYNNKKFNYYPSNFVKNSGDTNDK